LKCIVEVEADNLFSEFERLQRSGLDRSGGRYASKKEIEKNYYGFSMHKNAIDTMWRGPMVEFAAFGFRMSRASSCGSPPLLLRALLVFPG